MGPCAPYLVAAALLGAPPTPYPDLSDPKSAAFSLEAALEKADVKTARSIYVGDDKVFLELLDVLAKAKVNLDKYNRLVTERFGEYSPLLTSDPTFQTKIKIGKKHDVEAKFSTAVALAEVKVNGDEATVRLSEGADIRLKKTAAGWKVTQWFGPHPLTVGLLPVADEAIREVTKEIESGRIQKPYELLAAQEQALRKAMSGGSDGKDAKDKKTDSK